MSNVNFSLEEIGGDRFPDLESAQAEALPALARDLAITLQDLLTSGILVIKDGYIIPNPDLDKSS